MYSYALRTCKARVRTSASCSTWLFGASCVHAAFESAIRERERERRKKERKVKEGERVERERNKEKKVREKVRVRDIDRK